MNLLYPVTVIFVCIGLAMVATLLQLAAFIAPMWYWLSKDGYFLGIGLWYITGCLDNCTQSNPDVITESNVNYNNWHFNLIRAMETLGLIGGVILCLCLIVLRVVVQSWKHVRCLRCCTICVSFLTTTVLLIGSLIFTAFYHSVMTDSIQVSPTSFPWSFIMSLIALVIFVVVCVLLLLTKDEIDTDPYAPSVNKMALIPNGNNKGISQSEYTDDRVSGSGSINDYLRTSNGFSNKAYSSDVYNPYFRPHSYAEPPSKTFYSPYKDTEVKRSSSYQSKPRYLQYREPRYTSDKDVSYMSYNGNELMRKQPDYEPTYSRYVEGHRHDSRVPSELRYTKEIRDGNSSSFMYKPHAPQRY